MGDDRRRSSPSPERRVRRKYSESPPRSPPRRSSRQQSRSPPRRREDEAERHRGPHNRRHSTSSRSPTRRVDFQGERHRGGGRGGGGRYQNKREGEEDFGGKERWGKPGDFDEDQKQIPDKHVDPDFGLSGALAAETNTVNGTVLLHNEPGEARPPTHRWRLYTFKDGQPFEDPLHIHRQSRYIFGRERKIADIPTDHPSCSKQHAVVQFRLTEKEGGDGMMVAAVRPYLMDLGSTNGTFLNGERIEAQRYYELLEEDMIKFGNSSREYVLLKEKKTAKRN